MFGTRIKKRWIAGLLSVFVLPGLVVAAYTVRRAPDSAAIPTIGPPIERDLEAILARDTLFALTSYNATSYFLYRGEPMGFEYELLKVFAEEQGVVLQMYVVPRDSLLPMLNRGVGDVAAAGIIPADQDTARFRYTASLYETRPVIVQQGAGPEAEEATSDAAERATPADSTVLPGRAESDLGEAAANAGGVPRLDLLALAGRLIRRPRDLAGRTVHLPVEHPYHEHLVEIEDEAGNIRIVEVDTTNERLIRQVARGEISLTVAPENLARLEESYFTNLEISPTVGPMHVVTWAVRGNSPNLLRAVDTWIEASRDSTHFKSLYQKYFVDRNGYRERVESRYLTAETRVLSDFDALLRQAADSVGWDWRLLASQAYQESRFDARARSWAGAAGILQLMPATAREVGVADPYDPAQNVAGAARYLRLLDKQYWRDEIADDEERVKFILASYNAGAGHVMDARRLAEKHGDDPDRWEDVAYWLLQKAQADVINDPVVQHGYCRGLEPVQYVARILDRYAHYRQFVPVAS